MAKKPKGATAPKTTSKSPSLKMIEFTAGNVADVITATGAKKSGKLLMVPPEGLTVMPGFNLRIQDSPEYKAGIEDLKNSIILEGFFDTKAITGFPAQIGGEDKIVIIDGHRRYEAALAAIAEGMELDALPVVLRKATSSDLDLAVALHKENASVPMTVLERAVLVHRMLKAGEDEEAIAARLQVSVRHVNDLKMLINAPKGVRDLVKAGVISGTEAILQLRKDPTGAKIMEAAEKAAEKAEAKAASTGTAKEARLTRQTIEDEGTPKVKMQTIRNNFQVKAGTTFIYADAEAFMPLLGDDSWYKNARKKTERIATQDISIEVKIRRPKSAEQVEAEAEAETATAAAKSGRPKKPVAEELAEDDGFTDDGEAGVDLRELGIAEPASASAEM